MKKNSIIKYFIYLLLLVVAILCSSCDQSVQEEEGVNLLPQNRPVNTDQGTIGKFQF